MCIIVESAGNSQRDLLDYLEKYSCPCANFFSSFAELDLVNFLSDIQLKNATAGCEGRTEGILSMSYRLPEFRRKRLAKQA